MKNSVWLIWLVFVCSCTVSEKYEQVTGEWECISWISKADSKDKCNHNVYFKFNEDKTYTSKLGKKEDQGNYKITDDILAVSPEGKMDITVRITKLNSDTMVFLMNQAGVEEILTLVKKNPNDE
jgi:hypothetical protein